MTDWLEYQIKLCTALKNHSGLKATQGLFSKMKIQVYLLSSLWKKLRDVFD